MKRWTGGASVIAGDGNKSGRERQGEFSNGDFAE
jgi:hypothetical protein